MKKPLIEAGLFSASIINGGFKARESVILFPMKSKKSAQISKGLTDNKAEITKQIGARIKQLRLKQGHTSYEDFAYENNISRSQFGKYERGADMRISSLTKVMSALNVTVKEFFSEGFE